MQNGLAFVVTILGDGLITMQLLSVVSWVIPLKVCVLSIIIIKIIVIFNFESDAVASCCGWYGTGPDKQPFLRDYFSCEGSERNLSECSRSIGSECGHGQDVIVICS